MIKAECDADANAEAGVESDAEADAEADAEVDDRADAKADAAGLNVDPAEAMSWPRHKLSAAVFAEGRVENRSNCCRTGARVPEMHCAAGDAI